jgi:hypothetical protein
MPAVAAGRKDDWLALFAPDAIVQESRRPVATGIPAAAATTGTRDREFWDRNFGSVSRFRFRITDSLPTDPAAPTIASITMWLGDSGATITVDCVVHLHRREDG